MQQLHSIVVRVENDTILRWAESKACQIAPLASAVLSGFKEGAFVASLLATLARVPSFRIAIIKQDPAILGLLLGLSDLPRLPDIAHDVHSSQLACIALLSEPLPSSVALPISIHGFVRQLLERMTMIQDTDSIRAVYQVLYGQTTSLLELVPPELFEKFVTTCNGILRNNADHMRNVLCLALYAVVAKETHTSHPKPSVGSSDNSQTFSLVERWRNNTKRFFVGEKAIKNASLTVVRVLHFCSEDVVGSTNDELEGLQLCQGIIEAIEPAAISQWMIKSESLLRRLEGKLTSSRLPRDLAIAVCPTSTDAGKGP